MEGLSYTSSSSQICRLHCSLGDLLILRFSNGIYELLWNCSLLWPKFLTLTSKHRRKVKKLIRKEMFMIELNISACALFPTAGVKRRWTSQTSQKGSNSQTFAITRLVKFQKKTVIKLPDF